MYSLNAEHARLLMEFADKVSAHEFYDLRSNHPFVLRMTKGRPIKTPRGDGFLFSIGMLQEPFGPDYTLRMTFVVVDNRQKPSLTPPVIVYPVSWQNSKNGLIEKSATVGERIIESVDLPMQQYQKVCAELFIPGLKSMGYLQTRLVTNTIHLPQK
jgi:hypothetical protein